MGLSFESWIRHNLNFEIDEAMNGALIEKVEVSKQNGHWRIHLDLPRPVERDSLDHLARLIEQNHEYLDTVDFRIRVINNQAIKKMIMERRQDINSYCLEKKGFALSDEVVIEPEGHRMNLIVDEDELYEGMLNNGICSAVRSWLKNQYSLETVVRVLKTNHPQAASNPRQFVIDQNLHDASVAYNPPAIAAFKSRARKPEFRKLKGNPLPLKELTEGMRGVLIEAVVLERNIQALKGGSFVVSYALTDYADSILAKIFLDRPEDDGIEPGSWLRFKGGIRYDQYHRDIALFIEAMMPIKEKVRQDDAPVKRVELHAHTKMSFMDGLTDVSEMVKKAARWGHSAIAITDHGCVQSFPDAYKAGQKHKIKVIFGVEAYLVEEDKKEKPYHIIILARNDKGLHNLYQLVSKGYIENFHSHPKIKRSELQEYRQGLMLGSACEKGELFQALMNGAEEEQLASIIDFYDYLEIQPPGNNQFLVRGGQLTTEGLQDLTRRIVDLGIKHNKPVVATGDVHFLEPHEEQFKTILLAGQGYKDSEDVAPLYLKSTAEMMDDLSFLGSELSEWVVVACPNQIAAAIDDIKPVPDGFCPPVIDGSEEEITRLTYQRAREVYGDTLNPCVEERIERELKSINGYGYSVLYLVAHRLVRKSNLDGYLVGSRGSVGSSLVAFLTGITEVNALPPHYICPACKFTEFIMDGSVGCGPDLPERVCPHCESELYKDGFDIPFETFMGFEGDKVPDIDLNFSGDYQSRAHAYVEEIFGRENVFRAGTISTIAEQTAFGFVKKWCEEKDLRLRQVEMTRLARGITGVRRTTGQHPGGLVVVPRGRQITEFTPIQHPADNKDGGIITTHFDYHAIDEQLVKLDILGHDDPTVIRMLEDLTSIKATGISLSDPQTLSIFSGVEALGVGPGDIDSEVGTFGIPEFGTRFVRQMLNATRPTSFADLVRISGLSHGTDVWLNNAQELIHNETATLREVICTRDDIMTYLIYQQMDKKLAFKIMESVRKGRGVDEGDASVMMERGIPDWYVESCRRIRYMFPKAHAVAYVTMAFRIAWFKVNYPLAFYAAYFSVRADELDPAAMLAGIPLIKRRIEEIDKLGQKATDKEKKLVTNLEVALEMHIRGYRFYPVDLMNSDASRFQLAGDGLLMPFSALAGVGETAAKSLVEARGPEAYLSIEDLQVRSRVNKTVIEVLRQEGCLEGLPESSQMTLF